MSTPDGFALSPQQLAVWRHQGHVPVTAIVHVDGPLDPDRLGAALRAIVRRHEILRTRFTVVHGLDDPIQVIGEDDSEAAIQLRIHASAAGQHEIVLETSGLHVDERSCGHLVNELAAAYAGDAHEEPPVIQYADYARWALDALDGADGEASRRFWAPMIGRADDRVAAAGDTVECELTAPLDEPALLTVWAILCGAIADESPLVMAVHGSGRQHAELHHAIGALERWLPVELPLDRDSDFHTQRNDVARRVAEALQHQDYWPVTAGARATGGFSYREEIQPVRAEALTWRLGEVRGLVAPCPLLLRLTRRANGVRAELRYASAAWSAADAARLLAQYGALVSAAGAVADRPWGTWAIGAPAPARSLVPAPPDVVETILAWAAAHPAQVAVRCGAATESYAGLCAAANGWAATVADLPAEARVGLALERGVGAVAAWLGLLGAGVTVVSLDAKTPPERLAAQAEAAALRAVIGEAALATQWPAHAPPLFSTPGVPMLGWPRPRHPAQLAYVLLTSGSTGTPKGVAIPHAALAHYAASLITRLAPPPAATWELVSPLTVDLGYTSLLGALTTGGTLHWRPADEATSPGTVGGADYLKITPTHLTALLAAASPDDVKAVLPRRALLLGGEAPSWALRAEVARRAPALAVFNHYGPTETTIGVLVDEIPATPPTPAPPRPWLGRPLAHVTAAVLDADGAPVLAGAPGHLWIAGPSLARGYDRAPGRTAAAFRPDPDGPPGSRRYDTGDRVRETATGQFLFLGRSDRQLKLRGHRLDPADVEAVLARHPAVAAAVVLPHHDALAACVSVSPRAGAVARLLRLDRGLLPDGVTLFDLPNGITVAHQSATMTRFVFHEIFEERTYVRHGIRIDPHAIVIDVGANIGLFTAFVAATQPTARIIAVEPIPDTFEVLRINCSIWAPDAHLECCGLSDSPGAAMFTHYPAFSGASGLFADPERDATDMQRLATMLASAGADAPDDADYVGGALADRWGSVTVPVSLRTVSEIIADRGLQSVDLLKIDAERSELQILEGISAGDWPRIRQVVLEAHGPALRDQVQQVLAERGFDVICDQVGVYADSDVFQVYAVRPAAASVDAPLAVERFGISGLTEELHQYMRAALPEALCPSLLRFVVEFPRTGSGKVDHEALAVLLAETPTTRDYVSPSSDLERAIARQWSDLLRYPCVGATDNFFALGGHSLLAIQGLSRLRTMVQLEIPLRCVFDAPTPRQLAVAVAAFEPEPGHAERAASIWLEVEGMSIADLERALEESA